MTEATNGLPDPLSRMRASLLPTTRVSSVAQGGVAGAIPGYISGKNEAVSDYSRLLFFRRLGIRRPGELEALLRYPETTEDITEEGVQL